jgi:5-methylcytosine-specific restriction endonuclease McrA
MMNGSLSSTMRTCTKCNCELSVSSFGVSRRVKSGLKSICKGCCRDAQRLYANTPKGKVSIRNSRRLYTNTPKAKNTLRLYLLSDRGKAKIKGYRQLDSTKRSVRKHRMSDLGKATMRRFWISDKGKALKARSRHNRRANIMISPSTLTANEWEGIKRQYKYRCVYCGEKKPLTRDHLIPLSKEGSFVKENVVPACHSCNAKKGTKPVLLQMLAYAI